MARLIKVFVCDDNGRGLSGQRVKMYGGSEVKTDSQGIAELLIDDGGDISIYVNGTTAYSGSKARLPSSGIIAYRK